MKKIVRLTESDLIRLVNRVIIEQNSQNQNYKGPDSLSPDQRKFYDYVSKKWNPNSDEFGLEVDFLPNSFKLCAGGCKSLPGTDSDTLVWDWSKNQIFGTKQFGVDPKPLALNSTFDVSKKWFDSTWK